jgi:two-component system, LytTR family, sensor kinase
MKKSALIMFHLLFWVFTSLLVILIFQLISLPASVLGGGGPSIKDNVATLLIILPIGGCLFYASYFSLNFFVKRPARFIWIAIGYIIFTLVFLIPAIVADLKSSRNPDFLASIIVFFPILYFNVFGFLFRTFIEWIKDRKIKAELEKDKIASQLELLKSKLNPHFLFNTLNNIDVLIQEEPNKASEYLRKLSEILRFMLYESNVDKISLTKEIEYIKKYIDLQKIRTANMDYVKFEITGDPDSKIVAPMIFIHFIENAFKFASNKKIENAVNIKFEISDNILSFYCNNHKNISDDLNSEKNGLGIYLIRQKLELIYKKNYNLHIKDEDNWYKVNLEIQLDEH